MPAPVIFWFRSDLRLGDNPALAAAGTAGRPIVALYAHDDAAAGAWRRGAASRWWLHGCLQSLANSIAAHGGALVLRRGDSARILLDLVRSLGAEAVFWNRRYEPWAIAQDTAIKQALRDRGVTVESFNGALGLEPWEVLQKGGEPYKVFTPYWRAWQERGLPPAPSIVPTPRFARSDQPSDALESLDLLPRKPDWAGGLRETWRLGESAAEALLEEFLAERITQYADTRDFPAMPGVSRLSPHLQAGTISPRRIMRATALRAQASGWSASAVQPFLRQLVWRDFAYSNLYHFPHLPETPLRAEFARFPWADDLAGLQAWQRGRTGYPIVDAAMRELWHTGYMHNRARMIVGSLLTKGLLIPWQAGAKWFWDSLIDADLANNSMGWQWVAGSGIDAAPYFRIFNPWTQSRKFDPEGRYVRRWVPELAGLGGDWLHEPHLAPPSALLAAGIERGRTYPLPIVDHAVARGRALAAFEQLKSYS